jgi:penicillin amidase
MTNSAGEYFFKEAWRPMTITQDTILVKDSSAVIITVKSTHHGPVVNDVNATGSMTKDVLLSMRWTGQEISDEIYSFLLINKAKNWTEFKRGVKEFTVPGQNFVYADNIGNIGYLVGIRLPIRSALNPTLPMPGWTGQYDWTGFVPFDKFPSLYNPPKHYIASANNKMTDRVFPYHVSNLWEPPSRIQRIDEMLRKQEKFAADDFRHMQADYFSHFAEETTPYILHAYDSVAAPDADVQTALSYFRNWHFRFSGDDVPTTLFHVFFTHLLRNVFMDKMGEAMFRKYIFVANIPYRVVPSLLRNPSSDWFDDTSTPQIETRDVIIRKSLAGAIEELKASPGGEMKTWQWGLIHTITFRHPLGAQPPLGSVFNIGPFPIGGSGTTVNNGEYYLADPYQVTLGPSTRQIVDFSDLDGALSVIPTGQSGQPMHEHYSDQTALWLSGEYHTMPLDSALVNRAALHTLRLLPMH